MEKEELRNRINLKVKKWQNMNTTNCYAFALGLDIPEIQIASHAYCPGNISFSPLNLSTLGCCTYEDFFNNLILDLNYLGLEYKTINPLDATNENEWKIALFLSWRSNGLIDDFHFLRCYQNGLWYHKSSYFGSISYKDSLKKRIYNPQECTLNNLTYSQTLKLSLKK